MRFKCRCRKCSKRKTLSEHPADVTKCSCGGLLAVDSYRTYGKENAARNCFCSGFPWSIHNAPHSKGSSCPEKGWYCHFKTARQEAADAAESTQTTPHPS